MVIDEPNQFFPDHLLLKLHIDADDLTKHEQLTVPLYSKNSKTDRTWLELSRSIDVVALELKAEELKRRFGVLHTFRMIDVISPDIVVGVGDPLLVIGYPEGFSDSLHNLPVFRQASVASVYPVPFDGNRYFLIDSELHPGTSGSAVITQPSIWVVKKDEAEHFDEPQYRLIGIHSGSYGDLKLNVVWFANLLVEICRKAPGIQIATAWPD